MESGLGCRCRGKGEIVITACGDMRLGFLQRAHSLCFVATLMQRDMPYGKKGYIHNGGDTAKRLYHRAKSQVIWAPI